MLSQPNAPQINTPFILAPPFAARAFYSSISGSRQLPPPYDQFHAYPCFNPPKIHFEFAGWNVEVLKGKRDKGTFSPGGRFSSGRMAAGSGYCVGIVVESRMGKEISPGTRRSNTGPGTTTERATRANGLEDVWIVGEPFFRDVQVAFNVRFPIRYISTKCTDRMPVEGEESWHAKSVKISLWIGLLVDRRRTSESDPTKSSFEICGVINGGEIHLVFFYVFLLGARSHSF
jgi:hypothetical protein